MKTSLRNLVIFTTLVILNGSCNALMSKEVTPSVIPPTIAVPTIVPPSATSTFEPHFDAFCWPVKLLQEGNDIKGGFIYANFVSHTNEPNHMFLWDVSSFRANILKNAFQLSPVNSPTYISPDGKFIAALSNQNLVLFSSDGERSFPLPNEYIEIDSFLPDGRILLVDRQHIDENYQEGPGFTDVYYLLDTTTGKVTKNSVFLSGLALNSHNELVIRYSPNMKYILYRSASEETDIKFTLYDLEKNEVVWVGPSLDTRLHINGYTVPVWKPDSSALITLYSSDNESNYYAISLDGKVSPITSFGNFWLDPTFSPNSSWSYNRAFPNQSPNGRYLVSSGGYYGSRSSMYIWDNKEEKDYKPCLPNEERKASTSLFTYWLYGADDSYFVISLGFAKPTPITPNPDGTLTDQFFQSYILDLDHRIIYELPEKNNMGEFPTIYQGGYNKLLGWVNWEIP
jgi:hypothetical protein